MPARPGFRLNAPQAESEVEQMGDGSGAFGGVGDDLEEPQQERKPSYPNNNGMLVGEDGKEYPWPASQESVPFQPSQQKLHADMPKAPWSPVREEENLSSGADGEGAGNGSRRGDMPSETQHAESNGQSVDADGRSEASGRTLDAEPDAPEAETAEEEERHTNAKCPNLEGFPEDCNKGRADLPGYELTVADRSRAGRPCPATS